MNRRKFITALAAVIPSLTMAQVEDIDDGDFTPEQPQLDNGDNWKVYCGDSYGNWWTMGDGHWDETTGVRVVGEVVKRMRR